ERREAERLPCYEAQIMGIDSSTVDGEASATKAWDALHRRYAKHVAPIGTVVARTDDGYATVAIGRDLFMFRAQGPLPVNCAAVLCDDGETVRAAKTWDDAEPWPSAGDGPDALLVASDSA